MIKDLLVHMMDWLSLKEQGTSAVRVCREWREAGYSPSANNWHSLFLSDVSALDNLLESPLCRKVK
jgi:hypothetical protein